MKTILKNTSLKFYAFHWSCGRGTCYALNGNPAGNVHRFDTMGERDAACANYRAPNHCPTAALVAIPANSPEVRHEIIMDGFADNDLLLTYF